MRSTLKFLLPALAASLTLAACGSSSKGSGSSSQASSATSSSSPTGTAQSSSPAVSAVVKTASNATLGYTVLVDAQGMTLYRLGGEQNGRFICTNSACLQLWHPVSAPAAGLPSGSVSSLGKVKRPDGTEQVTYQGMPLYTFAQDQQSGDAKGQGLKDVGTWTAVRTGASASSPPSTQTTPPPRPAPPAPPSSGGGSGY
jgi:predicted lipoprotein with Yx(FWY)xxD motif